MSPWQQSGGTWTLDRYGGLVNHNGGRRKKVWSLEEGDNCGGLLYLIALLYNALL